MTVIDSLYEILAAKIGWPVYELKQLSLILLPIPLSLAYPCFPAGSQLIHIWSIAWSYIFHVQVLHLHLGYLQLMGQTIATWLAVEWCRYAGKGKAWTWMVVISNMAVLAATHIAAYVSGGEDSIVLSEMVIVMKLTLFAWACHGGTQEADTLDEQQQKDRLDDIPSLLDILGYVSFVPSVLAGPNFSYSAYSSLVNGARLPAKFPDSPQARRVHEKYRKAAERLMLAIFFMMFQARYGEQCDFSRLLTQNKTFLWKLGFLQLAGFVARTRFYCWWSFSEAAMILSGIAYNAETGDWDAWSNVDILQVEFAGNFKVLFNAWNKGTNYWLKEAFYRRLTEKGRKSGFVVAMITFAISAFWHGLNPVYFLTFILAGLFYGLGQQLRLTLRPLFLPTDYNMPTPEERQDCNKTWMKRLYDLLSILFLHLALNFTAVPFMLMHIESTLEAWADLHYYGLLICFIPYAFLLLGGARLLQNIQRRRLQSSCTNGLQA